MTRARTPTTPSSRSRRPARHRASSPRSTNNQTKALPEVSGKAFEANKRSGDTITLDDAAKQELQEAGDTGVVVYACVGANGKVTKTFLMPRVANNGPTAKAVAKATKTWSFEPFKVRDKAALACGHVIVK